MAIELRHLRSFVAVAEEGKIGHAADRLYITQPALSRQIQQLEREVGVPLLIRGPSGVDLTEAGRELLDKARLSIEAADAALAVGRDEEPHGRLVLGHSVAGGRQRWFELTQAFADRYPAVEVEVREAISGQLQHQVLARELDGAIALIPERLDGLAYSDVCDVPLSVWLHRDHPLADRREMRLADFDGQEVLLLGGAAAKGSGFNAAIRELFAGTNVQPSFAETFDIYPPRAALMEGTLTISVQVDFPEGVVSVPLVPRRTLPVFFVQRAETNRAAVRAYASFAGEYFRGDAHAA